MAASKVQANWSTVSHGSNAITKVTGVTFGQTGSNQEFAGDTDRFATLVVNLMTKVSASVKSADIGALMGIAPGTVATFTATHKDAAKQTGGDIVYAMINAVVEGTTANGPFGAYGDATLNLKAFSSDGTTNPLSFTRA
jgi:hypothetical protein